MNYIRNNNNKNISKITSKNTIKIKKTINYLLKLIIVILLIQVSMIVFKNTKIYADDDKLDITYTASQPSPDGSASELSSSNEYGLEGPGVLVKTPLFIQWDDKWGNLPYGIHYSIAEGGCGITSCAMIISALTQKQVEPPELAAKYGSKYAVVGGSTYELFPAVAKDYGLKLEQIPATSMDKVIEHLKSGGLVVANMGPGHFTSGGHYIVLKGVSPDGKIYVNDPASKKTSSKLWDPQVFIDERRGDWAQFFLFSK